MKLLILIFLIKLIFNEDNIDSRCIIDNQYKNDCGTDIKDDTEHLETNCKNRGCCYEKIEGNTTIPWCYNKSAVPTTIITNIPINCDEKCLTCNQESLKYHLCLSCKEGYMRVNYTTLYPKFYDCHEEKSPILKK